MHVKSLVHTVYLAARLARQWMKERGIVCMTPFSLGFLYLAARLAPLAR